MPVVEDGDGLRLVLRNVRAALGLPLGIDTAGAWTHRRRGSPATSIHCPSPEFALIAAHAAGPNVLKSGST